MVDEELPIEKKVLKWLKLLLVYTIMYIKDRAFSSAVRRFDAIYFSYQGRYLEAFCPTLTAGN